MLNSQLCHKEASMLGSSNYERGSSWAVEVGGNLKVCSIMVENLNKNGQMVVEVCNTCEYERVFSLIIHELLEMLWLIVSNSVLQL